MIRHKRNSVPLDQRSVPSRSYWEKTRKMEMAGTTPSVSVTRVSTFRLPPQKTPEQVAKEKARERKYKYQIPEEHRNTTHEFSFYATRSLENGKPPLCGVALCRAVLEFDDVLFCQKCRPKVEEYLQGMLDLMKWPPIEQVDPTEYLIPYFGINVPGGRTLIVARAKVGDGTGGSPYQSRWSAPTPETPRRRTRGTKTWGLIAPRGAGVPRPNPSANRERDQREGGGVGPGGGEVPEGGAAGSTEETSTRE